MKNLTVVLTLALAITVVLVFAAGCTSPWQEKAAEETVEKALEKSSGGDVEVDSSNETMTITTEEGETTWGETEIPENFPGNAPIYPGAKAIHTHVGSGQDEETATALLETSDSVDEVADWYETEIDNNGWTIEETMDTGYSGEKMVTYIATQGDEELSVGINSAEGQTSISISVYKNKGSEF